jgi:hypothetical protein
MTARKSLLDWAPESRLRLGRLSYPFSVNAVVYAVIQSQIRHITGHPPATCRIHISPAMRRHYSVPTLLRHQHLGEGVRGSPGSYIDGRGLGEEGILER